jgi:hypothetical protein
MTTHPTGPLFVLGKRATTQEPIIQSSQDAQPLPRRNTASTASVYSRTDTAAAAPNASRASLAPRKPSLSRNGRNVRFLLVARAAILVFEFVDHTLRRP